MLGAMDTAEGIAEKISLIKKAQPEWGRLPYRERSARLAGVGRYLAGHKTEIIRAIHEDNGKLLVDALATELIPAIMALDYYRRRAGKAFRSRKIPAGSLLLCNKRSRIICKPYGAVGIISPWNYPFAIPFSEVVMALLAGNGVILKVASSTPRVGRCLEEAFNSAGLPPGVFSYTEFPGAGAGPAFIAGGVDKLFFTGSTAAGRTLMALAAPRLLPLVLELGGADAAIVCADANLDRAALGILWAAFSNAGQSCGGVQRILVEAPAYEPFLKKLCALVEGLRLGSGIDADMGPMAAPRHKQTLRRQVEACLDAGARIAARSPNGSLEDDSPFAPAILLTGVTEDMPVMKEEMFGPVAAVLPVRDDEEALRIANSSSYGLTGSVWSGNPRRARLLAERLHAGAVTINDHLMSHGLAETPWGGYGDSGLGRTHGAQGLREMVREQVIVEDLFRGAKRNLWWHPYSREVFEGLESIANFLSGRLSALPRLLRFSLRYWK